LNFSTENPQGNRDANLEARDNSQKVLTVLFERYPPLLAIYEGIYNAFNAKTAPKKSPDFSFLFGKFMLNDAQNAENELKNISDKVKKAIADEAKTIIKARAVEEIKNIEIDKKAQEDYVLSHNFEKVETAEEFDGVWRDFDGDDELADHQDALDELNMKVTVRTDDTSHSVYQADFMENTNVSESAEIEPNAPAIEYPEWDYQKRAYKENFCKLFPLQQRKTDSAYREQTLLRHKSLLLSLRKMLTNLNNKFQQQRRQTQGENFDFDCVTDLFVDVRSGHTPSEKIYLSKRKKEKDLSVMLLLDISLSSDGYVDGRRVLDVEKQVAILFGEILNEFQVDFAVNCFFSKTRNYSTYLTVKDFDQDWLQAKDRVGAVEASGYTRIGTALRHSGKLLEKRETQNKWLILISDGKPNDYDRYEGKYGIADVKQAVKELNERHVNTYALAIEANAKYYLPQMFGENHYQIVPSPQELVKSLARLYEKIKHRL
jgi:nitric oxide reductase NorD protein